MRWPTGSRSSAVIGGEPVLISPVVDTGSNGIVVSRRYVGYRLRRSLTPAQDVHRIHLLQQRQYLQRRVDDGHRHASSATVTGGQTRYYLTDPDSGGGYRMQRRQLQQRCSHPVGGHARRLLRPGLRRPARTPTSPVRRSTRSCNLQQMACWRHAAPRTCISQDQITSRCRRATDQAGFQTVALTQHCRRPTALRCGLAGSRPHTSLFPASAIAAQCGTLLLTPSSLRHRASTRAVSLPRSTHLRTGSSPDGRRTVQQVQISLTGITAPVYCVHRRSVRRSPLR